MANVAARRVRALVPRIALAVVVRGIGSCHGGWHDTVVGTLGEA